MDEKPITAFGKALFWTVLAAVLGLSASHLIASELRSRAVPRSSNAVLSSVVLAMEGANRI